MTLTTFKGAYVKGGRRPAVKRETRPHRDRCPVCKGTEHNRTVKLGKRTYAKVCPYNA
jgi:hypothetical protein